MVTRTRNDPKGKIKILDIQQIALENTHCKIECSGHETIPKQWQLLWKIDALLATLGNLLYTRGVEALYLMRSKEDKAKLTMRSLRR